MTDHKVHGLTSSDWKLLTKLLVRANEEQRERIKLILSSDEEEQ